MPPPTQRITPILSKFLKRRRKTSKTEAKGTIIEVPHPPYPSLQLDRRKWAGMTLTQVTLAANKLPRFNILDKTVSFLYTPFALQYNAYHEDWLAEAVRLLEPDGWWIIKEVMPVSMPGHWLHRYFPQTWGWIQEHSLTPSMLYSALQRHGFEIKQEQTTYYQAVRPDAALALAKQREASVVLNAIDDDAYQAGLSRLKAECKEENQLLASQICIVEVVAQAGKSGKSKEVGKKTLAI